jgi:DNA-binding response OmpR family regulator
MRLSNLEQNYGTPGYINTPMGTNSTVLCIHRDPAQLSLLQEHGYKLATASNGPEGLRILRSRSVDAVVIEYQLGLLDCAAVADEIKQARPQVPIVMLADHVELPASALKSVDALVVKSDGPHFLLATVHFVLTVRPAQRGKAKLRAQTTARLRRPGRARGAADGGQDDNAPLATDEKDTPLSKGAWRRIRNGTIQF